MRELVRTIPSLREVEERSGYTAAPWPRHGMALWLADVLRWDCVHVGGAESDELFATETEYQHWLVPMEDKGRVMCLELAQGRRGR